jgi:hypothetical protein
MMACMVWPRGGGQVGQKCFVLDSVAVDHPLHLLWRDFSIDHLLYAFIIISDKNALLGLPVIICVGSTLDAARSTLCSPSTPVNILMQLSQVLH